MSSSSTGGHVYDLMPYNVRFIAVEVSALDFRDRNRAFVIGFVSAQLFI